MLLQDAELKAALLPYTLEGPHGRLLDADHEDLQLADTVCFEMEDLMSMAGAVAPIITYLFHRLEARFDGRPTILILDEAWLFLDDPIFAARIREWLKTLRKKNVSVLFATQSLADIARSEIAPAIIESCPTRIFLPNARAVELQQAETYEQFGLNDRQVQIISQATPKRDYYFQSPLGARLFELGLGPIGLALCGSSSPEDQKLISECLEQGSGKFAAAFLKEKGIDWAEDVLAQWPGCLPELEATENYAVVAAE